MESVIKLQIEAKSPEYQSNVLTTRLMFPSPCAAHYSQIIYASVLVEVESFKFYF